MTGDNGYYYFFLKKTCTFNTHDVDISLGTKSLTIISNKSSLLWNKDHAELKADVQFA